MKAPAPFRQNGAYIAVGLCIFVKDMGDLAWRHPDAGVGNVECERSGPAVMVNEQRHPTLFGKFDCVAADVEQDLPGPVFVANDAGGNSAGDAARDFNSLCVGAWRQKLDHTFGKRGKVKRAAFEIKPARFNF